MTCYRLDGPGFRPHCGQEIFSSPYLSKPALGPTQPLLQWVLGLFPRQQVAGCGITDPPSYSAEVENGKIYTSNSPLCQQKHVKGDLCLCVQTNRTKWQQKFCSFIIIFIILLPVNRTVRCNEPLSQLLFNRALQVIQCQRMQLFTIFHKLSHKLLNKYSDTKSVCHYILYPI